MKTSNFITVVLALVLTTNVSFAQGRNRQNQKMPQKPATPEKQAEMMTKHMTATLSLTEEQIEEIYDINLKFAEKNKAPKHEKMDKSKKRENLTEEQKEEWKAAMKDMREKKMAEMKKAMEEKDKAIFKVLNDDQDKIYQAELEKRKTMRMKKNEKRGHQGPEED